MRQVRNCLSSPMTITLLRKSISSLILFSMGTGGMLSPLDVIISSGGERGSDKKEVQWKKKKDWREWWEEEGKEGGVECTILTLYPASDVQEVTLYSKCDDTLEIRHIWTYWCPQSTCLSMVKVLNSLCVIYVAMPMLMTTRGLQRRHDNIYPILHTSVVPV